MTTEQQQTPTEPGAGEGTETETEFSPEYVRKLRAEAAKYRTEAKANADAAARLAKIEDEKKTAEERLAEALTGAQSEASTAKAEALRYRVALQKGIPAELVGRLQGDSEESLAADADSLLALLNTAGASTPRVPRPDPSQGGSGQDPALNGDPLLRSLKTKLNIA